MAKKRIKKWIAFALAAVVTATSVIPGTLQNVYADTTLDPGNPFGQNVARGKRATITSADVEAYKNGLEVPALTDGDATDAFEAEKIDPDWESTGGIIDYNLDYDIDLEGFYLLDRIVVYQCSTDGLCKPGVFDVQVSKDKENWTTIDSIHQVQADQQLEFVFGESQEVRYVRVACKRTAQYNTYRIAEIEAYTIGTVEEELSPNYALGKACVCVRRRGDSEKSNEWFI